MKTISTLSKFLLKTVVVFGLVLTAALVGVGVAALFAFHETGGAPGTFLSTRLTTKNGISNPARLITVSRLDLWQGQEIAMNVKASLAANRFVAATASDKPQFTYADYQPASLDQPAPTRQAASNSTTLIPPPLLPQVAEADDAGGTTGPRTSRLATLSDPGSHYILDPNTGRIIGIDGTAGAKADVLREQQEAQAQVLSAPPVEREVRAALPIDAPVVTGLPPAKPNLYPAVRRALPVDPVVTQSFDATAEVADNDNRPVLRALPVSISDAKPQRRLFSFP